MTLVRPARPSDTDAIRRAHVAAIERFGPEAYEEAQVAAWADRSGADDELDGLDDPETYVVVAERAAAHGSDRPADDGIDRSAAETGNRTADGDREVVGFGRLDLTDAEVVAVYVHPDHAREGVGSTILAHLEGYARARAVSALSLWASLNAVGFYERAGYERVRRDTHETSVGVELTCVVMEKRLERDE